MRIKAVLQVCIVLSLLVFTLLLVDAQEPVLTTQTITNEQITTCSSDADCATGFRCFENPNPESTWQCQPEGEVNAYEIFVKRDYTNPVESYGVRCPGGYGCSCGGDTAVLCEHPLNCISRDLDTRGQCCTDADDAAGLCPPDPADAATAPLVEVGVGEQCGPNYRAFCTTGLSCVDFVCTSSQVIDFNSPEALAQIYPTGFDKSVAENAFVVECGKNEVPVNNPIQIPCPDSTDTSCTQTLYRAKCKDASALTPSERQGLEAQGYVFQDVDDGLRECIAEFPYSLAKALPTVRDIPDPFKDAVGKSISEIRLKDITFWLLVNGDGTVTLSPSRPSDRTIEEYQSAGGDLVGDVSTLTGGVIISPVDVLGAVLTGSNEYAEIEQTRSNSITGAQIVDGRLTNFNTQTGDRFGAVDSKSANTGSIDLDSVLFIGDSTASAEFKRGVVSKYGSLSVTEIVESLEETADCLDYNGKTYCKVTSEDTARDTGVEVCNANNQRCIGYTEETTAVCSQFHPSASTSTGVNGDVSGAYCDGPPQTSYCSSLDDTCIECPSCTVGISCTQPIGNLYREMYVECADQESNRYAEIKSITATAKAKIGLTVYNIDKTYAELRQGAIKRCPNKPEIALYLLAQMDSFTLPNVELTIPSVQSIFAELGGNELNAKLATQRQIFTDAKQSYTSQKGALSGEEIGNLGNEHFDTVQTTYTAFAATSAATVNSVVQTVAGRDIRAPFDLFPPPTILVDEIGGACGVAERAECVDTMVCAGGQCMLPKSQDQQCVPGACLDGLTCFLNPNPYGRYTCQPTREVNAWNRWSNGEVGQCPGGVGCECDNSDSCRDPLTCNQIGGTVAAPDKVCCTYVDWLNGVCAGLIRENGQICQTDSDCKSGDCSRTGDNQYTCV